jgi:hypothetical protein
MSRGLPHKPAERLVQLLAPLDDLHLLCTLVNSIV